MNMTNGMEMGNLTEQPSQVFNVLPDLNHFENFLQNGSIANCVLAIVAKCFQKYSVSVWRDRE